MSSYQLGLPPEQFAVAFPFHLAFDRKLNIVQIGEALERVSPDIFLGSYLPEHFLLKQPPVHTDFDSICEQSKSLFVLESVHNQMPLKGQMIYVEDSDTMFFLCTPWITEVAKVAEYGLSLTDFALHDPVADFLLLLQSKNMALTDTKKLTNKLELQRSELRKTNLHLATQHVITNIIAGASSLDNSSKQILEAICKGLNWEMGAFWERDFDANLLRCAETWVKPSATEKLKTFADRCCDQTYSAGVGLPGRVWENREAVWIENFASADKVLQLSDENSEALKSAFGFPVLVAGDVLGIIEFFSCDIREEDKRMLGIMSDVGVQIGQYLESRQIENALRESEEKTRKLIDNANDIIYTVDLSGRFTSLNRAGERLTGYTQAEALKMDISDAISPEDAVRVRQRMIDNLKGAGLPAFELEIIAKDGSKAVMDISSSVIVKDGVPVGLQGIGRDITERKLIEEELRRSEERFQLAASATSEIIWDWDLTTNNVWWSEAIQTVLGYDEDKIEKNLDWWLEKIHPDDVESANKSVIRFLDSEEAVWTGEYRFARSDDSYALVSSRGIVVRDKDNKPLRMVGALVDITDRKRVETERQVISEIAQSVITTSNLDELFKLAHQSIKNLLPAENCFIALHNPVTDIIHFDYWVDEVDSMPAPRPVGKGFTSHILRTGQPLLLTEEKGKQMSESGEVELSGTHAASWMGVPLRTPARTIGVLAVQYHEKDNVYDQRDLQLLTAVGSQLALAIERKQTEIELQTREAKLTEAQAIAHLGSWEWDIGLDKVTWSDELYRIFGLKPQEFGATFDAFLNCVHPDEREMMANAIGSALQTYDFPTLDHRIIQPDGKVRFTTSNGKVILNEKGLPVKMLGISQDITERKQMEEELKAARDIALESARLKSEFLANMSHEIRTPMNGVIGMTGLLLDTDLNDEQRDFTETVRSSAESLMTIINDILDFSKIEAGKMNIENIDFDLRNTVESTISLLAEQAQNKGIELASLVESDVPTLLYGDAGRIRQILLNLTGNGVKFTEHGEVTVSVTKESETDSHVTVRFAVRDSGIGISEAEQKRLFQLFVQADGSTTRKYGGTGLGLAISKQIVELLGGSIGVDSVPGKGSTFWFTLNLEKQSAAAVSDSAAALSTDLHNLRLLIADDNRTNRQILSHQAASWGINSVEAESGSMALELLRAAAKDGKPFNIALLDFNMPEMNDFKLAREIKTDGEISNVKLVLMPSFSQHRDEQTAREIGIEAYLPKPVKQSQLFDCLMTVMNESKVAGADEPRTKKPDTLYSAEENLLASGVRILIAEDNLINQKVSKRQVENLGYRADIVENGVEALEALSRIPYDIVLMDCQMPLMDGFEATAAIRRREQEQGENARRTVIIALTANALEGEKEKCLTIGMDDYLSKPVDAAELQKILKRWQPNYTEILNETNHLLPSSSKTEKFGAPPVDMNRLFEAAGDDNELAQELVEIFLRQAKETLDKIDIALADDKAGEVNRLAHTAAGSSATIGISALVAPLKELEQMGADCKLENAPLLIAKVKDELARVELFFKELITK